MKHMYSLGLGAGGILGMSVMSENPSIPVAIFTGAMFLGLGIIQKQRCI